MTGKSSYSQKISEFQAEGLGFRKFAWLGSNPSYAPGNYSKSLIYYISNRGHQELDVHEVIPR